MGQGQEVPARRLLQQAMTEGRWVMFQNCHLGLAFTEELYDTLTTVDASTPQVHDAFRCWITTEPHNSFPINLLQISIKFTNEPPQGVKPGLKRTYNLITQVRLIYIVQSYYAGATYLFEQVDVLNKWIFWMLDIVEFFHYNRFKLE